MEAKWDSAALWAVFRHRLSDPREDKLACRDHPNSLDELIDLAICLDNCIRERKRERGQKPASAPKGLRTPPFSRVPFRLDPVLYPFLSLLRNLWTWLVHVCPPQSDNAGSKLVSAFTVVTAKRGSSSGRLGALMSGAVFPDNPQTQLLVYTTLSYPPPTGHDDGSGCHARCSPDSPEATLGFSVLPRRLQVCSREQGSNH